MTKPTLAPIIVDVCKSDNIISMLAPLGYPLIDMMDHQDQTATNMLEQHHPHMVIVDHVKACQTFSQVTSIPILAIGDIDDIDALLSAGATDVICLHPQLLLKRVQEMLDKHILASYDDLPSMMSAFDDTNSLIYVNQRWQDIFGYTREEVIGQPVTRFMTETSRRVADRALTTLWTKGTVDDMAFRYIRKDGQPLDVVMNSRVHTEQMALTILHDITSLNQAQTEIRQTKRELQGVVNAVTDSIFVLSHNGDYLQIVSASTNQYDFDNLVGSNIRDVYDEDTTAILRDLIDKTLTTHQSQQYEHHIPQNQQSLWQAMTLSPLSDSRVVFAIRDITERKLAERELIDSERRYRSLFENASDAILVIDVSRGTIIQASPQATRMFGYSQSELIGMQIDEIESSEIMITEHTSDSYTGHDNLTVETVYTHKEGHHIIVESSSRLIKDSSGLTVISFLRDITERRQATNEIERQRNLAEALLETANILNTAQNLDDVMAKILSILQRIMPVNHGTIMLIEDGIAKIARHIGFVESGFESERIYAIQFPVEGATNLRWVYENKRALIIHDTHNSEMFGWADAITASLIKSILSAPIIIDDEVIGFINLDSTETNIFNEQHEVQLMAFANQVSIAIQQAQSLEALNNYAEDLEKKVAERTIALTNANDILREQIYQRRLAEENLEAERALLQTLIDNIPDQIYFKNRDEQFLIANKAALDIIPNVTSIDEIRYKTNPEIFTNEHWVWQSGASNEELLTTGQAVVNKEEYFEFADGSSKTYLITKVPLYDAQGDISGFVGINRDISELKTAQAQLSDERNLLRLIIDTIPDAIYVKDTEGRFILANQSAVNHIDQVDNFSDLIGKTDAELYPEIADRMIRQEQHLIATGEKQLNQLEMYDNPDGSSTHLLVTKLPLRDNNGNITGLIGVNHDISELREAEAQLELVLHSARCLLWSAKVVENDSDHGEVSYSWTYTIANEAAAAEFLPLDTSNGSYTDAWLASIPESEQAKRLSGFDQYRDQQIAHYSQEFKMQLADNQTYWLNEDVQIKQIADGSWHLVGVCTDITTQKAIQKDLEQRTHELDVERSKLEAILNAITDGVMYADLNRKPLYINQALIDITGYGEQEWFNGDAVQRVNSAIEANHDTTWQATLNQLDNNGTWKHEYTFVRKDGSHFLGGVVKTSVTNKHGERIGVVTAVRDISREKALEEQKARFIANAAHELRTPIANIKTRLFLMKRTPERFMEHIQIAESVTNLMQNLVEHMFDIARFERGVIGVSHEPVNLHELFSEVIEYQQPQADRLNISLALDIEDKDLVIQCDPYRITQVIVNLIGNALTYSPSKSTIVLGVQQVDANHVHISVSDQGKGISPEHIDKLFLPFYRIDEGTKGTGLGLAIVHEIIQAHDGKIDVDSTLGEGTTFDIYLPVTQTEFNAIKS